ncbi:MAG TPA: EAL domain-containing protein, partial [Methylophilus sp.]
MLPHDTRDPSYFFSLRWKLLFVLLSAAVLLGIASAYYFQQQLLAQFAQVRKQTQDNYTEQLNGLISLDIARVRQLAATLPSFALQNHSLMEYADPQVYRAFDDFWSSVQIDMGVDVAKLYSSEGQVLATWGEMAHEQSVMPVAAQPKYWQTLFRQETPAGLISCTQQCSIIAFAPILQAGKVAGVFSVQATLADSVLSFQKTAKADVVMLFKNKDARMPIATLWGMHMVAASNPNQSIPLLTRAARQLEFRQLSTQPARYVEGEHQYEISLVKLAAPHWVDGLHLLVVEDIAPNLAIAQQNIRQIILFTLFATLLLLALMYGMLSLPLQRLRRIATVMPLLGQSEFETLRVNIPLYTHPLRDEVDVLDQSALDLSYQLESLQREVLDKSISLRNLFNEVLTEKEFISQLLNQAEVIIATLYADGRIASINQFGLKLAEKHIGDLIYNDLSHKDWLALQATLGEVLQGQRDHYAHKSILIAAQTRHTISWIHTRLQDQRKGETLLLTVGMDITEQVKSKEAIHQLAHYDVLTNLPNRRLLIDRLKQALINSSESGHRGALLFIDIDHFKSLNDTLGHQLGDLILQEVAKRLTVCLPQGATVSHIGSDEFIVILEQLSPLLISSAVEAEDMASKLQQALNQAIPLNGQAYQITVSISISLFNNHDQTAEALLIQVDIAMHEAKRHGPNSICFYHPHMQESLTAHVTLERELYQAVINHQFVLYYQLQVDSSNHAVGAEALIRWQHPQRWLLTPLDFIPLAEETGLIVAIGQWVLEAACAQLNTWQQSPATQHLSLAVNVNAQQFLQANFVTLLAEFIQHNGINPQLLKLELTESMLVDQLDETIDTMHALQSMGIQFSLDDFGTGYSSLQYLKRLPINQLKIDKSFVRDIADNVSDQVIVRTIIAMAQTLNLN